MSYDFISVDQDANGIVVLTINNMQSKNAVNFVMNHEIVCEAQRVEGDPTARVLIVTGQQHIFCSGGNIRQMTSQGKSLEPPAPTVREELYPHEADMRAVVVALRRTAKPTIAAINGHAIGSGLGIAAGCDIRIAARGAKFGWVFARRGIVPDDASLYLMPQLIGYSRAFEWGITGRTISAEEAERIGFVSQVLEPADLLPRCRELAMEIIENVPPITAQAFKLAFVESLGSSLEHSVGFAERAQRISRNTEDHSEALRAYAERRPPLWQHK